MAEQMSSSTSVCWQKERIFAAGMEHFHIQKSSQICCAMRVWLYSLHFSACITYDLLSLLPFRHILAFSLCNPLSCSRPEGVPDLPSHHGLKSMTMFLLQL